MSRRTVKVSATLDPDCDAVNIHVVMYDVAERLQWVLAEGGAWVSFAEFERIQPTLRLSQVSVTTDKTILDRLEAIVAGALGRPPDRTDRGSNYVEASQEVPA